MLRFCVVLNWCEKSTLCSLIIYQILSTAKKQMVHGFAIQYLAKFWRQNIGLTIKTTFVEPVISVHSGLVLLRWSQLHWTLHPAHGVCHSWPGTPLTSFDSEQIGMLVTLADSNSHEILTIIPPVRVLYSLTNALLFSLNSTSEMLTTNQMKNRSEKVKK